MANCDPANTRKRRPAPQTLWAVAMLAGFAGGLPALPATADDCAARIAAMYDGGPMDPFERPPHTYVMTNYGPGNVAVWEYAAWYETPVQTIGGIAASGMFTLIHGSESWTGPAPEGPWTKQPNHLPEDHAGFIRSQLAQSRANVARAECFGEVEMDGQTLDHVRYFTKTDPTALSHDAWFGGLYDVFTDLKTGHVMRMEVSEAVSSFAPDPAVGRQVTIYSYDPSVTVARP